MDTIKITAPSQLNADVLLPASKSISNRALIINALSGNNMMPENLAECDDTDVMRAALSTMPDVIDIHATGTSMRFLTAYLSLCEGSHAITGSERMRHRPIRVLVDALRFVGADIRYVGEEGFPPLQIEGRKLHGGRLSMPGNISSQYISALLLIAPMLQEGLTLQLTGEIVSKPYIELTLGMMRQFGAQASWISTDTIEVAPHPYEPQPSYPIENDWTAASYWYEAVALSADSDAMVQLDGLSDVSMQGDAAVRFIYSMLGVKTVFASHSQNEHSTVTLKKSGAIVKRLVYDFVNIPDLAQTLAVTCCGMGIPFHFSGLGNLRIKETDRLEALSKELSKLGYAISVRNDSELIWDGQRHEPTGEPIDTYQDHRMAMAFAPLACRNGSICINDPAVVKKSYPRYWEQMQRAGFIINPISK